MSSGFSTVISYLDEKDMKKLARTSHDMKAVLCQTPAISYLEGPLTQGMRYCAYGPSNQRTEAMFIHNITRTPGAMHPYPEYDIGAMHSYPTQREIWNNTKSRAQYVFNPEAYVRLNHQLNPILENVSVQGDWEKLIVDCGYTRSIQQALEAGIVEDPYAGPPQLKSIHFKSKNPDAEIVCELRTYCEKPKDPNAMQEFLTDLDRTHPILGLGFQTREDSITNLIKACPSLEIATVPEKALLEGDLSLLTQTGWQVKEQEKSHIILKKTARTETHPE